MYVVILKVSFHGFGRSDFFMHHTKQLIHALHMNNQKTYVNKVIPYASSQTTCKALYCTMMDQSVVSCLQCFKVKLVLENPRIQGVVWRINFQICQALLRLGSFVCLLKWGNNHSKRLDEKIILRDCRSQKVKISHMSGDLMIGNLFSQRHYQWLARMNFVIDLPDLL